MATESEYNEIMNNLKNTPRDQWPEIARYAYLLGYNEANNKAKKTIDTLSSKLSWTNEFHRNEAVNTEWH